MGLSVVTHFSFSCEFCPKKKYVAHSYVLLICFYSPTLNKLGYSGFALSFRHSVCHSFFLSNYQLNFHRTFLKNCKG